MSLLFTPLPLQHLTLKNRLVVAAMCQYSSIDGFASDWHLVHLGTRAVGGASLVITEAAAVTPEGRISPEDLGIWKDEHIVKLRQITDFIHTQGALAGIQLAHAGRKASTMAPWKGRTQLTPSTGGWNTLAPSALAFNPLDEPPVALTIQQIESLIEAFADGARRAVEAGFDVIEIHGAHGYLIHQFLSPLSNHRTDEYGGSFENRIRFLREVTHAVKSQLTGSQSLWVRLSATDWADEDAGWSIAETVRLSRVLKELGVELIDTSTGGLIPGVRIPVAPGYQVSFAAAVRKEAGMLSGAVGLITEAAQAEAILAAGAADVILMARELLRNPYFPLQAQMELDADAPYPLQYERAKPHHS
ncbi:2,4-dienoyl-CoA reductase [Arachidicoccus rhizosphaerae]|uniref:2,4-dienoyl-CoA reductase n=1 Tax=Arachidicoccus rhizosphaerae TaxID=551991 RepID=A0A1H3Y778_9BACT|nr:NADH:flavin oxidoreductase/NADH oxidase [Arachidicoccus rhizosphaerae]SEA07486.1 2,4-dienoyl-CoA reductase [Arachidicoccus rhizosphaerae]